METAVLIDGQSLSARHVTAVARFGARVELTEEALQRLEAGRRVVERAIARGERIYGVTTSVGAKSGVALAPSDVSEFNHRLILTHNFGHGPTASREVVRAMMVSLLNSMATGALGVRPRLATRLVEALNTQLDVRVHTWGSTGESDMSPVADLVMQVYEGVDLAAGEAIALINSSPLSLGTAAIAFDDIARLLDSWSFAAALSMEGFAANPSILSEAAVRSRPFPGLQSAARSIRGHLEGSALLQDHGPRHLQDALCFRSLPVVLGNALDCLRFAQSQLTLELNASQNNPIVSIEEDRLVAVANFDMLPLSMALDTVRLAMSPVVTSSTERVAKLADSVWSGLSVGLIAEDSVGLPGFNGLAQFHKSLTAEARLLAAPVVGELPSSSHSNGILDRVSMSALAARRTQELAALCKSILGIELLVAAQAVQMRGTASLGRSTQRLFEFIRTTVPYAGGKQRVPHPAPLLDALERCEYRLQAIADGLPATPPRTHEPS